jgi:hypothetical protein
MGEKPNKDINGILVIIDYENSSGGRGRWFFL